MIGSQVAQLIALAREFGALEMTRLLTERLCFLASKNKLTLRAMLCFSTLGHIDVVWDVSIR